MIIDIVVNVIRKLETKNYPTSLTQNKKTQRREPSLGNMI
jgi:hypothetical protein